MGAIAGEMGLTTSCAAITDAPLFVFCLSIWNWGMGPFECNTSYIFAALSILDFEASSEYALIFEVITSWIVGRTRWLS